MAEGKSKEFSDQDFEQKVIKSKTPILINFGASWCAACKPMESVIADFTKKYANKIEVLRINVDKNQRLASKYKVMSLPTILIFHQGKVAGQIIGVQSLEELEKKLKEFL